MLGLRWSLGIASALVGVGWLVLGVLGNSFRASFGASAVDWLTRLGPLVVMALVLASVMAPGNRVLLHLTAVAVAAAGIGGALVLRESVFVGTLCLAYCGAWFFFYVRTAW
jgi:hypothetical protein